MSDYTQERGGSLCPELNYSKMRPCRRKPWPKSKPLEAAGRDTALTRGLANAPTFFKNYFSFYLPARQGHSLDEALIELIRLKVARLNDCFT